MPKRTRRKSRVKSKGERRTSRVSRGGNRSRTSKVSKRGKRARTSRVSRRGKRSRTLRGGDSYERTISKIYDDVKKTFYQNLHRDLSSSTYGTIWNENWFAEQYIVFRDCGLSDGSGSKDNMVNKLHFNVEEWEERVSMQTYEWTGDIDMWLIDDDDPENITYFNIRHHEILTRKPGKYDRY